MPVNVVMPQMGESIFEGTVTKWLKKIGEKVERDEPLFEISTDKVDAEIPAPSAGVLKEIKVKEGETVEINTVVAILDDGGAPTSPETSATEAAAAPKAEAAKPAAAPPTPIPPPPVYPPELQRQRRRACPPKLQRRRGHPLQSSPECPAW